MDKKILNQQSEHWESNFSSKPVMFGLEPSYSAKIALEVFKKNKIKNILELGAGLGRDTIFFAQNGIYVHAIDYSLSATNIIKKRSEENNLEKFIKVQNYDIRQKLNFDNQSFQACYSHMLFCMALTNQNLKDLNKEIGRILKKDGINIYTVRNQTDGDFKKGVHRGEDMYEMNGFIVHYFSENKVKKLLDGFINLNIENFNEGSFPRKLFLVINKKK
ncbi:class I SAM-dependent methyltransferase [Candidatus Pelagibacter sp.]|nr:class I SAM-dependent methyltransferase [Candidatus Pelagibacter sp.]